MGTEVIGPFIIKSSHAMAWAASMELLRVWAESWGGKPGK